ncbi:hypothetical protein V7S76_01540 [Aquirufa sp. ROCK2-A2]
MKFCVKHFLKILLILSLGLGLNGIAKSSKTYTKNQKFLHTTSGSAQNQFLLDIEEEEIEEEVDPNKSTPSNIIREASTITSSVTLAYSEDQFANYPFGFDIIKADKISHFLAFQNLRL